MRRVVALGALVLGLSLAASAAAANRVYWANDSGDKISFARLDGLGGGDLNHTGATMDNPRGTAIDLVHGRIYFANYSGDKISFARLNGSGGGDLVTTGATVDHPTGLALDTRTGRIYWANDGAGPGASISFARLNGSGGGDLNTTGATVLNPEGVALDIAGGRIFWANNRPAGPISFARLDGSGGGGDLNVSGATIVDPGGVAIHPGQKRVYWSNPSAGPGGNSIGFANLNGTGGGGVVNTGTAHIDGPFGVGIDTETSRIYWGNWGEATPASIGFALLDGSGGSILSTGGATKDEPDFPSLLKRPRASAKPGVRGGHRVGARLTCVPHWSGDVLGALLFRRPVTTSVRWLRNGRLVPGASARTLRAHRPGSYRCRAKATNQAGTTISTSAGHRVR